MSGAGHRMKAQKSKDICDVLMIVHERPEYLTLALPSLLESGDETMRVWIWQNGSNREVAKILDHYSGHERIHKVHKATHNAKLREPTNWLWRESDATYIGKVDDDTLVPKGWLDRLKSCHAKFQRFGVLGLWVHPRSDYDEQEAKKKISKYRGQSILENSWMAGSGYLMKRACVVQHGLLAPEETFPAFCVRLAWLGWINGWPLPLSFAEHMDDPRSRMCILKTQEDFEKHTPLTAARNNVKTLDEWKELNRMSAKGILKGGKKAGRFFWVRSLFCRALFRWRSGKMPIQNSHL